jgi:hypothetical protein
LEFTCVKWPFLGVLNNCLNFFITLLLSNLSHIYILKSSYINYNIYFRLLYIIIKFIFTKQKIHCTLYFYSRIFYLKKIVFPPPTPPLRKLNWNFFNTFALCSCMHLLFKFDILLYGSRSFACSLKDPT